MNITSGFERKIDEIIEKYREWNGEKFDEVRVFSPVCGNVQLNLSIDKRSSMIEKLNTLGIREIWGKWIYIIDKRETFTYSKITIKNADLDEFDYLVTKLAAEGIEIAIQGKDLYSNVPRTCCKHSKKENMDIFYTQLYSYNRLQTELIRGQKLFNISRNIVVKEAVYQNECFLKSGEIIPLEYLEKGREQALKTRFKLFNEEYPKINEELLPSFNSYKATIEKVDSLSFSPVTDAFSNY